MVVTVYAAVDSVVFGASAVEVIDNKKIKILQTGGY
jgi:hypothetical protein